MANIIDALVVTFGYDTSGAIKGNKEIDASLKKVNEASRKLGESIAAPFKEATGVIKNTKVQLLGLLAVFGVSTGLKDFILGTISGQAEMGRFSQTVGISTQRLDAWNTFARRAGATAKDVQSALHSASAGIAQAAYGPSQFLQEALSNGIALTSNDTPEEALLKIAARMHQLADGKGARGRQLAISLGERMGIDDSFGQAILSESMGQMTSSIAQLAAQSRATPESVAAAQKIQAQMADISQKFRVIGETIFIKIAPVLEKLATKLSNFLDTVDWDKVINKVTTFADKLSSIVDALGGVKGILIEIAAIKVFGWVASIGMWVAKLRTLTLALQAARAASVAGAATEAAGVAGVAERAGAGAGLGFLSKFGWLGEILRGAMWAPRPLESPEEFQKHVDEGLAKARKESIWQGIKDAFSWGGSDKPGSQAGGAPPGGMIDRTSGTQTRGIRNNNPGNLVYNSFTKSLGATGQDSGGFAIFPTPEQGLEAIEANLRSYGRKGVNTPYAIAHRWSTTDQDAYTKRLASMTGGDPNRQLDMSDPRVLAALSRGIVAQENGYNPYLPANSKVAAFENSALVAAKVAAASTNKTMNKTSTSTAETHIGTINVNTKATDSDGIAKGIKKSLDNHQLVALADTGPE